MKSFYSENNLLWKDLQKPVMSQKWMELVME